MAEAPTGTITFLFTDVEGSTRLWQAHPEGMRGALATHDGIVRDAIESHDGYIFSTGGDSFAAAFGDPLDAVRAALDAQHALSLAQWGEVEPLKVRMALDTGLAELRDGDYFGPPLNRAARIEELANGGQILLSNTTADLVRYSLPSGFVLEGLGERKLRDVERPVTVFQLQPESAVMAGVSRGFLIGGLAASGAVLAIVVIAAIVLATRSPSASQPVGTGTSTVDETASGPVAAWSIQLTGTPTRPLAHSGAVYVATNEDTGATVVAYDMSTGDEVWRSEFAGAIQGDIQTDGAALFLFTRDTQDGDRIRVVDPATGVEIGGCGLVLPSSSGGMAVAADAIYAISEAGSAYLVPTDSEGSGRCHEHSTENRTFTLFPPLGVGPVAAGSSVIFGDSRRVYELRADDLVVVADYGPGEGRHAEYRGTPSAIAAAGVRIQTATVIEETVPVYVVDGEGLLHSSTDGVGAMRPTEIMVAATPLVHSSGVVLVDEAGTVASYRHDLTSVDWEVEVGSVRDVQLYGGRVYITHDAGVTVVDATSGDGVWSLDKGDAMSATADGGWVYVQTDDGVVEAFAIDADPSDDTPVEAITPRSFPEPIALVEQYFSAFSAGDSAAVFDWYATDAAHLEGGHGQSLMVQAFQDDFVAEMRGHMSAAWTIEIANCRLTQESVAGTEVTCDATAQDHIDELLGIGAADGYTELWIADGLVRRIRFQEAVDLQWLSNYGFFYLDTPEYTEPFQEFTAWLEETYPESLDSACNAPGVEVIAVCIAFLEELAVEYVAETGG